MRLEFLAAGLALAAFASHAQLVAEDPDWREVQAPPPAALKLDGLIPLDIPRATLRFGVVPASIQIGSDGIVRYVVVATSSSGTVNAIYEGLRCGTGEMKVYARHNPDTGWAVVKDSAWVPLQGQKLPHALYIARNGACMGHGTNGTAATIARDLRSPVDSRFNNESRAP